MATRSSTARETSRGSESPCGCAHVVSPVSSCSEKGSSVPIWVRTNPSACSARGRRFWCGSAAAVAGNPREPAPSSARAFVSRFDARNLAHRSAPLTLHEALVRDLPADHVIWRIRGSASASCSNKVGHPRCSQVKRPRSRWLASRMCETLRWNSGTPRSASLP